ncbi:hypothetical protein GCM10023065_14060 [Microbacterium laevaniformans]|jgi:hypothetical protein|uniref:Uncharacterized protein n=1 Tax=Microbacterium lacticum TaxID=33885 RepID=A0A4Y3URS6_9MICO|nr:MULTISPECIES: hypothetical protein [Microbacterium]MBM7752356.1 hypothetical protein [Microbacterium laevaniformans]TQN00560.1 hypothetical protein FHX68_0664 [Microbacterium lacticum]GEB96080.1 hypothetical protein MLA01_22990 [Microbacterium lacticum]GGI71727.1 hypothetical protein GCM10009724_23270 [Microbacterium lacticum]GLJ64894.1 hypothetical protein GCM10017578_17830 [Microbacterium laevaniformans]
MTATTLEMGLQELEALEAPGFWTGFAIGAGVVGAGVAGAGLYLGAAALVAT